MSGALRVVFAGSPEVSVVSLEELSNRFAVPLVVTQPARPKGRGRRPLPTPLHARAMELGLEVMTAADINAADSLERIRAAKPDIIVVVSFGQILKTSALKAAPLGCVNLHFSLLPRLRGAAPVPWAIIRGEEETGVSIMQMTRGMDEGPVYAQQVESIRPDDTAAALYERLSLRGARLLTQTLPKIAQGSLKAWPQDDSMATMAPKITRADTALKWFLSAREVDRRIRGLAGQREAYAFFEREKPLRVIFHMSAVAEGESAGAGIAARGPAGELLVGCGSGVVEVVEIQAQGRRRLCGRDFANGLHISGGERFLNG